MNINGFKQFLLEQWDKKDYNVDGHEFPYEYGMGKNDIKDKQKYYENLHSDNNLTYRDKHFISQYTHNAYSGLNENLWKHKLHGEPISNEEESNYGVFASNEEHTHHLSKILDKMPAARENMTLYAGLHHSADLEHHIQNTDGIVHIPAFSSTSLNPGVASRFAEGDSKKILQIHVKQGQHVGGLISPHSLHRAEAEFLLKPNRLIKIHANPTSYKCPDSGKDVLVYHAHILDEHEASNIKHNPEVDAYHKMKPVMDEIKSPKSYFYGDTIHELSTTKDSDTISHAYVHPESLRENTPQYLIDIIRNTVKDNPNTNTQAVDKIIQKSPKNKLWQVVAHFPGKNLSKEGISEILKNTPNADKDFVHVMVRNHVNYDKEMHEPLMD